MIKRAEYSSSTNDQYADARHLSNTGDGMRQTHFHFKGTGIHAIRQKDKVWDRGVSHGGPLRT